MGGKTAGQVFEGDRRFDILVRLPESLRTDLDRLSALPFRCGATMQRRWRGKQQGSAAAPAYVPLGEVATLELAPGPNQISRENGKRRVVVTANVRGRDLGSFVEDAATRSRPGGTARGLLDRVRRHLRAVDLGQPAPAGRGAGHPGDHLRAAVHGLRSARDAAIVFSGVPLALTGGYSRCCCATYRSRFRGCRVHRAVRRRRTQCVVMITFISRLRERATPGGRHPRRCAGAPAAVLMTALVAALGFDPWRSTSAPAPRFSGRSLPW